MSKLQSRMARFTHESRQARFKLQSRQARPRLVRAVVLALLMVGSTLTLNVSLSQAQSSTIYVAPNGNDSNPGTRTRPKYSILAAMIALPNGGEVLMRGGNYSYNSSQSGLWQGGDKGQPLVIKSARGERASITSLPGAYCVLALGDYTQIRNLNCTGHQGIAAYNASHIRITGNNVHDLNAYRTQGIIVSGNQNLRDIKIRKNTVRRVPHSGIAVGDQRVNAVRKVVVDDNVVRQAGYQRRFTPATQGGWGSGISVLGANDVKITDNDVRRTYGEGINCPLSNRCRVRRNVVVDAWNVMYYGDNTTNSVWEDNVGKWTGNRAFTRDYGFGAWQASGFMLANEVGWYTGPGNPTSGNIIRNNVVIDVYSGVGFILQGSSAGLRNTLVANNTIIDALCGFDIRFNANNSGNEVYNNIVRPVAGGQGNCHDDHGVRFRNNMWTRGNGGAAAHSSDVTRGARFVGGSRLKPGSYKLSRNSPAIDAGRVLPEVWDDKTGRRRSRGSSHDIGAFEY